jgi:NOL1/NOP2/sun family putative RNA methylase
MKSYKELYRRLPKQFIDIVSKQYKPGECDDIFAGYMCKRPVTLRINRLKTDVRHVMDVFREENIKYERALWYEDALIIRNKKERDLEKHRLYQNGEVYLQSLSSMIPPLVLEPKSGCKVLDLTAAPGSKTTQIAALMDNKGYIMANELNQIRSERLKFNIERQGVKIAEVAIGDGKKIDEAYNGYFDKVLLDAPCSGTGLFLVDNPQTYRGWSVKNTMRLVREQKELIKTAVRVLKPGGVLVYSTCSIIRDENDENIKWMMENYKNLVSPETITLKPDGSGSKYNMMGIGGIRDSMMFIFPSDLFEGFFVSKFRKKN